MSMIDVERRSNLLVVLPFVILRRTGLLLPMILRSFKLEKLTKLIVCALIDNLVAVNFTKLVVMAKNFDFVGDQAFVPIVVPLND